MISSFFAKTKPINHVVLLVFMGLFYGALQFFANNGTFDTGKIWTATLAMAVLLLSIFLINELVQQNKVTALSSFAMLFCVILTIIFPETLLDNSAIFCNFFILLAIKKLLEVKEAKNAKHKIFDAVLFVCVATLFYKWAFIYFAAAVFAINTFESKNFKIWLVLLLGVATFFLLSWMFLVLFGNENFFNIHYSFLAFEWDKDSILQKLNFKNAVYFALIILFAIVDFIKLRKKGGGRLIMMRSMLLFFALVIILILLESKDSSPILLSFFPASVFLTNFIETINKKRLQELAVSLFILLAFMIFFIEKLG